MFPLINSNYLQCELDPVETDNYYPSVAFDITLTLMTTFQRTKIEIKECWIENYKLNQFQKNLQHFIEKQNDLVKLSDMSSEPVLQFTRNDNKIFFEVKSDARIPLSIITLKTEIDNDELSAILERIKGWAKWW